MKWLILLFTFIKPFFSTGETQSTFNPIEDLKEMIKENAVKVMLLFMGGSILSTLFAAGLIIIAVDIGAQYDQNAYIYFSSMITMGLILVLLPVIIGALAVKAFTNDDNSRKVKERVELKTIGTSHPLQDALALLVHDFVKEREMKRNGELHPDSTRTAQEELRTADLRATQAYNETSNPNFPRH